VVTVAVPAMADGGHMRFSMIPRLVFPEYVYPLSTHQRAACHTRPASSHCGSLVRGSLAGSRYPRLLMCPAFHGRLSRMRFIGVSAARLYPSWSDQSELAERAPSSRSQEMTFSCLVLSPLAVSSGVPCA
jgi:hypothetical protein